LLNGDRIGSGLAGFEDIVDNPSSVPASALFPLLLNGSRNVVGFANFDGLGEGFISFSDEAGCATADCSRFRTAAMPFHVNDGSPRNGLHRRCTGHGASNSFRASVRNPDGSAKDRGGRAENQGGKEESRG